MTKNILTAKEVAEYLGMNISYLYKLTMNRAIPYYKPSGKKIYFKLQEVEEWLLSNRISTNEEIDQRAQTYCMKGGAL